MDVILAIVVSLASLVALIVLFKKPSSSQGLVSRARRFLFLDKIFVNKKLPLGARVTLGKFREPVLSLSRAGHRMRSFFRPLLNKFRESKVQKDQHSKQMNVFFGKLLEEAEKKEDARRSSQKPGSSEKDAKVIKDQAPAVKPEPSKDVKQKKLIKRTDKEFPVLEYSSEAIEKIEKKWLKVLKRDPKNIQAYKRLGRLYYLIENYEFAKGCFETAQVLGSKDLRINWYLVQIKKKSAKKKPQETPSEPQDN